MYVTCLFNFPVAVGKDAGDVFKHSVAADVGLDEELDQAAPGVHQLG